MSSSFMKGLGAFGKAASKTLGMKYQSVLDEEKAEAADLRARNMAQFADGLAQKRNTADATMRAGLAETAANKQREFLSSERAAEDAASAKAAGEQRSFLARQAKDSFDRTQGISGSGMFDPNNPERELSKIELVQWDESNGAPLTGIKAKAFIAKEAVKENKNLEVFSKTLALEDEYKLYKKDGGKMTKDQYVTQGIAVSLGLKGKTEVKQEEIGKISRDATTALNAVIKEDPPGWEAMIADEAKDLNGNKNTPAQMRTQARAKFRSTFIANELIRYKTTLSVDERNTALLSGERNQKTVMTNLVNKFGMDGAAFQMVGQGVATSKEEAKQMLIDAGVKPTQVQTATQSQAPMQTKKSFMSDGENLSLGGFVGDLALGRRMLSGKKIKQLEYL